MDMKYRNQGNSFYDLSLCQLLTMLFQQKAVLPDCTFSSSFALIYLSTPDAIGITYQIIHLLWHTM